MKKYLKISIIIFLSMGVFFSLGLFALKIIFEENIEKELIVLGPDNKDIITKPKDVGGKKVSNLDIEILSKKGLFADEKLRLIPAEPELLPLEITEDKVNKKTDKIKQFNNDIIKDSPKKVRSPIKIIEKSKKELGLYRVQFGSFRNLDKAQLAKNRMSKQHVSLFSDIKLEIYSYTNNEKVVFHRVWTTPLTKVNGLDLCNKFKKQNIVCILQVNK